MTHPKTVRYAVLNDGRSRLELGWKPRDARDRVSRNSPWSDDWIKVYGRVQCEAGAWEFTDPSIMEGEALQLAKFLETRPWPSDQQFDTLDGRLATYARGAAGRHLALAVLFRGETAPLWLEGNDLDPDARWTRGFLLEMTPDDAGLVRFARQMRAMLGFEEHAP